MHESTSLSPAPLVAPADRASDHLAALARRWWLIVGCAILAGVGAYVLSKQQQPRYEATAKVLLTVAEPVNLLSHSTPSPSLDPERALNTDMALVKLDSVASNVQRELDVPLTRVQLLREVSVSADRLSNLLEITANDLSPTRAAAIANAFAAHYLDVRRAQAQDPYERAAGLAQRRLAELNAAKPALRGAALRKQLLQQLHQLQTTGELQTGGAQLVDRAQVPTTAVSPRPGFSAIVGALIGAMIGVVAALVAGVADRRRLRRPAALAATNGHTTHELPKPTVMAPERPVVASRRSSSASRD